MTVTHMDTQEWHRFAQFASEAELNWLQPLYEAWFARTGGELVDLRRVTVCSDL